MTQYRGMTLVFADTDTEVAPYLEEVSKRQKLVMRKCTNCGLMRYPPGAACPWCTSMEWEWQEVSGKGTIYSYEIVTQAIQPGFADWVPYPIVLVELDEQRGQPTPDEGLRIMTNLVDENFRPEKEENVAIGKRAELILMPLEDEVLLPQFKLSNEPPQGPVWQFPNPRV